MKYKWVALTVTTVGTFMASLDTSIVVIGLPTVLHDLNATIVHGVWIITGYRLMMVILLVLLGRVADMYGRVRLYNVGFAVFTIGSLCCGFSGTGDQLVLFRLLQGAGAALLMANSAAIITDAFPKSELGMGLGTNMMAMSLGAVAGYTLSGVMITVFGWRSIFFVNVPVGIFGMVWAYRRLKEVGIRPIGEKFDYAGSILYCLGLLVILGTLTIGDPTSLRNLAILAAGLALFLMFIVVERRQKYPTLNLNLFKIRLFAAGNLASFLNSLAFNCGPFIISLYLQLVIGYSALKAGLVLIPMTIVVFVVSPISGKLSDKYGGRVLSSIGLAVNASALFWFSTLSEISTYRAILISLVLFGLGRALFASPNSSSIMGSVPAERRGVANGLRMTLNMTGNVISIPLSLLLMTLVMPYDRLSQIVGSSQLISSDEVSVFLRAINYSCLILGVIILIAIIPSLLRGPREASTNASKEISNGGTVLLDRVKTSREH
jgi:EmrB/QacA subfamily drug resistance transporter